MTPVWCNAVQHWTNVFLKQGFVWWLNSVPRAVSWNHATQVCIILNYDALQYILRHILIRQSAFVQSYVGKKSRCTLKQRAESSFPATPQVLTGGSSLRDETSVSTNIRAANESLSWITSAMINQCGELVQIWGFALRHRVSHGEFNVFSSWAVGRRKNKHNSRYWCGPGEIS